MRGLTRAESLRQRGRFAHRGSVLMIATLISVVASATSFGLSPKASASGVALNGVGSSFAAPAIESWIRDVAGPPYNLSINYSSASSGQGRYEFTNETTDFAVSDTGYVGGTIGTTPPSFPYAFIPVTAAGVAFMYNLPGLTKTLQLSSYTACGILTGGITNWDDSLIADDNPGVTLPNLTIVPVTESDAAGTNYVLQEWCIDEQPALWAAFVNQEVTQPGGVTDGVPLSATTPYSNWPGILPNGLDEANTTSVAGNIESTVGAIGAVQTQYATDLGFGTGNPAEGVAAVKNASGDYTEPTPLDVTSALAYATQLPDGTAEFNFAGAGPNVYNPSTYSYLLTPTTGWSATKGAVMSAFLNYALTIGQQEAPSFGYASLGLSLEQYGINIAMKDIPGAVPLTSDEQTAYSCGDLTPTEVAAGETTPACSINTNPVSLVTNAPNGPFSSGQKIEVAVDANSTLTAGAGIYIEECAAPGGMTPASPSQCDANTYQRGNPLFAASDGSIDYAGYPIYALPDVTTLGESPGGTPDCDLSAECVLYVGQNPTDFSLPHLWSQPFYVNPTPGDTGANPGNGLPETPYVLGLPLLAFGVMGGTLVVRRRRSTSLRER